MNYVEVKYQDERTKTFLGSPSLVRLKDGALLATHDYFGSQGIRNREKENSLTSVYRSEDNGHTWMNITHIPDAFWGNLLLFHDELYFLSTACEYGDLLLRKSMDGGFTWSVPYDEKHGLLMKAGKGHTNPNPHLPITPWHVAGGRIYKAIEMLDNDGIPPEWNPRKISAGVMSAPEDADLFDAASWTFSNFLRFEHEKVAPALLRSTSGWLEGNIVSAPDGSLKNIMRVHIMPYNKAVILDLSDDGKTLSFDYQNGIIDFIGGQSKFTVRRDVKTGFYFTLTNPRVIQGHDEISQRNILCLAASKDLRSWHNLTTILRDESGLDELLSCRLTGFQYPDWQFDGDNILALVRTAYRGAIRFHDANRITFHVIPHFRDYLTI